MPATFSARQRGFAFMVATGVIWGTIGIAAKYVYQETDLDPVAVTWLRAAVAAPVCVGLAWRALGRRLFAASPRQFATMAGLGVVLILYQLCYFAAVARLGVSVATLVSLCVPPVLVAVASSLVLHEPLTRPVAAALAGALAGTALLVGWPSGQDGSGSLVVGVALSLGSATLMATHIIASRGVAAHQPPLRPLAIGFPAGALVLAPAALPGIAWDIPVSGWLLILYLGVLPSSLAYWMYQRALQDLTATTVSVITLLEPLIAAVLAWMLFDERLGPVGWCGAALLLGSIVVLSLLPERSAADRRLAIEVATEL